MKSGSSLVVASSVAGAGLRTIPARSATKRLVHRYFVPIAFLVAILTFWEGIVRIFELPMYLVPSPLVVLAVIRDHYPSLLFDAGITLSEAALGFLAGSVAAFALGAAFVHSHLLERGLGPYFVALQAVPIVATAPLLIIWFGNGLLSKLIMAALICFFPMVVTSAAGLRSVSAEALDLMQILGASKSQVFLKLRIPASLPFLFSGLRISAVLSVIGAIVAELAGASHGIGFRILMASYRTDTPMLFAAIAFSAAIGVVFYYLIVAIERLMMRRRNG